MDTPSETHFKQLVYNASRAATSSITIRHAQVCDPLRLVVLRPGGKVRSSNLQMTREERCFANEYVVSATADGLVFFGLFRLVAPR